jgi:hypothetical protein
VTDVLERDLSRPITREWLDALKGDPVTGLSRQEIADSIRQGAVEHDEQILLALTDSH